MIRSFKVELLYKIQLECEFRRELIEYIGQDATNTLSYKITLLRIKWYEFLYSLIDFNK